MNLNALQSVIQPLINSMCPAYVEKPKEKLSILIRGLLDKQPDDLGYIKIADRFLVDMIEKNPDESLKKLMYLEEKIGDIIDEIMEGEKDD